MSSKSFKYLLLLLLTLSSAHLFGQGTQIQFGQNRVQYKDFTWQFYESDHFLIYFNQGGQNLGRFTAQMAESDLNQIENLLDYKLNTKPEIIIYNNISDYNQSNFAVGKEQLYNIGGQTNIIGNKIFIYYDGNHQNLRIQIRQGIGKILVSTMIFGGNLQEIVQNAVLLNLPEWFTEGLVDYIGEEWNADLDNKLREGILSGKYKKFNKLTGEDARFAGHALWYYIAENYGEANIPNLLYLIRINRSIENGFLFVLGNGMNETIDEWYAYFLNKYQNESKDKVQPSAENIIPRKTKKNVNYHELKLSPDAKNIAYATDDYGRFKVYLQPVDSKDKHVIKKGGIKSHTIASDLNYPIITWSPDGKKVAIIYERRAKTYIYTYDTEKKEKETIQVERFQRILDASFAKDNRKLVMSVMNKGQSDIFVYYLQNARIEQITNDYYDDLNPKYVQLSNGYEGIIFVSNRDADSLFQTNNVDSILPVGNMDLFFYNYQNKSSNIVQLTHTKNISETEPIQIDEAHFAYLSDQNGIYNRFAGYIDSIYDHTNTVVFYKDSTRVNPRYDISNITTLSVFDSIKYIKIYKDTAYTFPITNFATNILEQDAVFKTGKIADIFQLNGKNQFYVTDIPKNLSEQNSSQLNNTAFRNFINTKNDNPKYATQGNATGDSTKKIINYNHPNIYLENDSTSSKIDEGMYFQTEFPEPAEIDDTPNDTGEFGIALSKGTNPDQQNLATDGKFRQTRIQAYHLKFSNEYVLSQLDNSLLINKYQSFNASGGVYVNPDLSGLFTVSISDLFEDYRFTGGVRFPTSFSGGEYFLKYEDLKKRIDKSLTYYYQNEKAAYTFQPLWFPVVDASVKTNIVEASAKYPFDVIRSLRATATYRAEKVAFLASDTFSLNLPNYKEDWASFKLEYTHDNTFQVMTNILNGTRYKIWGEVHKQFEVNADGGLKVSLNKGYMAVLGFDFRHYQKIHRQIVWANRIAGGTSFGPQKLVYYLGGVDSWLLPQFNYSTEIDPNAGYAFQTIATPLRGYDQNIRNGNSYAIFNSELRVPVFSYLFNKPIKAEFIRNFQVIGFFDVGSAWQGISPFNEDNPYNNVVINQPPVTVDVNFFRDPIVAGYGFGFRTTLFGYFIRADRAQGIELNGPTDRTWYFSLSLDF